MATKTHSLKTKHTFFNDVWDGLKTFEVRFNDRKFQVNDIVWLVEIDDENLDELPGRKMRCRITYILENFTGIAPGFVVFGIKIKNKK